MTTETKTSGELVLEVATLRQNRKKLEAENRALASEKLVLEQGLEGFEKALYIVAGDCSTARRIELVGEGIRKVQFTAKQFEEAAGLAKETLELVNEGLDLASATALHASKRKELEEALEKAKAGAYRVAAEKRRLASKVAGLEAELDRWEQFGLEAIEKARALGIKPPTEDKPKG